MLSLLWVSGLRIREVLRLNLEDVDTDNAVLYIRESKFFKSRLVPLTSSSAAALETYRSLRAKHGHDQRPNASFFINEHSRRCSHSMVGITFRALIRQLGIRTVLGYRDAVKLFPAFLSKHTRSHITKLSLADLSADNVLSFLNDIEKTRRCSVATRNLRLSTLRTFFEYLTTQDTLHAGQYQRVIAIPLKQSPYRMIGYLEVKEVKAVLYVQIDLEMKRKALSSCAPACKIGNLRHLIKRNNDIICWLESL